jgi:hypothetical protein
MQKRLFKTLLLSTVVMGGAIGIDSLEASPLITTQPLRLSAGQQADEPINDLNVPLNIRQEYKCPKELSFADIKELAYSKKRLRGHDYIALDRMQIRDIREGIYDEMMSKAPRNPWLEREWFSVEDPLSDGEITRQCLYKYDPSAGKAYERFAYMGLMLEFLMGTSTQYKLNTIAIKNTTDKEIVVMVFKSNEKGRPKENVKSLKVAQRGSTQYPLISDAESLKIIVQYSGAGSLLYADCPAQESGGLFNLSFTQRRGATGGIHYTCDVKKGQIKR